MEPPINKIPSLNFRNFLSISQKSPKKKLPSHTNNYIKNRSLFPGIFTDVESLKENYILQTLQPDLGSLTSFINLKEKPDFENYCESLKSMKFLIKFIVKFK